MLHMFLWISVELLVSRLILSLNLLYRSQKRQKTPLISFIVISRYQLSYHFLQNAKIFIFASDMMHFV